MNNSIVMFIFFVFLTGSILFLEICSKNQNCLLKLRFRIQIKDALSVLRQLLAIENSLKMMKTAFYFTRKALFVLKIFKFLSWLSDHAAKRLDQKDKVNFIFCDVKTWLRINLGTHIAQYTFFYKKYFYKKMSLKNPKTLRKC